jgi:carboxyl-terminal processing protease
LKNTYRPILIALLIVGCVFLGSKLVPSENNLIFNTERLSGIHKLNEILNYIEETYVDSISKDKLIEDGIDAMLHDLDPHSFYIPKSHYREMNETLEGNFEGIGIEFRIITDTVMVITAVPGGPSERAGLKAGDRLVRVNDSLVAGVGIRNEGVMKMLKGERQTTVEVGIKRKNTASLMNFEIIRDRIPVSSVKSSYMLNANTGYISIDRFSKNTYQEFKSAADNLLNEGMKNCVLDLRGNPGGLLNQAIDIANEFLERDNVIVYTEGKARPKKMYYSDHTGSLLNIGLVIILDEGSASASEVLAGAIQDNDRGTIVGRRSFGKGLVQEQVDWPDGSALRLTVARYYTPTGRSIQKSYEDLDSYHNETYDRLEHGELDSEDSIHVIDSLKYYTPKGKVVFGGGGIVPDIFIPLDSIAHNSFYRELYQTGSIPHYAFMYVDLRRHALLAKYPNWSSFDKRFNITGKEFDEFLDYAAKKGVEPNPGKSALLKERIKVDLKAQYARHLYGDEGFYPMLNRNDEAIRQSIKEF